MQNMHTHTNAWSTRMMIILTMLVVTLPSWGQYRRRGGLLDGDHYHFVYLSGHVGYSILDSHSTGVMPSGKVGGGFGVG